MDACPLKDKLKTFSAAGDRNSVYDRTFADEIDVVVQIHLCTTVAGNHQHMVANFQRKVFTVNGRVFFTHRYGILFISLENRRILVNADSFQSSVSDDCMIMLMHYRGKNK